MLSKIENINFRKIFVIFFVALLGFGIVFAIAMIASGNGSELALWWDRITLARIRGRMFADIQNTFRLIGYLFLVGFNVLLTLWVHVDGKKHKCYKAIFPVLTLFTGLIGWLIYMIKRVECVESTGSCKVHKKPTLGEKGFKWQL